MIDILVMINRLLVTIILMILMILMIVMMVHVTVHIAAMRVLVSVRTAIQFSRVRNPHRPHRRQGHRDHQEDEQIERSRTHGFRL